MLEFHADRKDRDRCGGGNYYVRENRKLSTLLYWNKKEYYF
jgi:hypothetical protein